VKAGVDLIVQQMLSESALSPELTDTLLRNATSPSYWAALAKTAALPPEVGLDDAELERAALHFREEGYFATRPVIAPGAAEALRSIVERVVAAGWPAVFAFACEPVWAVSQSSSLVRLLTRALGEGYRHREQIYCHWVSPVKGAAGWSPHVDGPGSQRRLSVWVPLSDATLENGCMMVIPKSRLGAELQGVAFHERTSFGFAETHKLLHAARALPAKAGSLLGWDFDVVHWGSMCDGGGHPRVSLAIEFESAAAPAGESPRFDPLVVPPLEQRMTAIARAVLGYARFVPMLNRYRDLATRLLDG